MKSILADHKYDIEISSDEETAKGTILSSIINLANTILGTGMLSMPFVFANVGLAQGVVLVTFTGMLSIFGLSLLAEVAQAMKSRTVTFNSVAKISYPAAAIVMDLAISVKCFGVSISYLVVGMILKLMFSSWISITDNYWCRKSRSMGIHQCTPRCSSNIPSINGCSKIHFLSCAICGVLFSSNCGVLCFTMAFWNARARPSTRRSN
jgi:hypothetical protein